MPFGYSAFIRTAENGQERSLKFNLILNTKNYEKIAPAACILSLVSVSASAQFMRAQGTFSSDAAELTTILLDKQRGVIAASAEVIRGACSGSLSGIGTIKGKTLINHAMHSCKARHDQHAPAPGVRIVVAPFESEKMGAITGEALAKLTGKVKSA